MFFLNHYYTYNTDPDPHDFYVWDTGPNFKNMNPKQQILGKCLIRISRALTALLNKSNPDSLRFKTDFLRVASKEDRLYGVQVVLARRRFQFRLGSGTGQFYPSINLISSQSALQCIQLSCYILLILCHDVTAQLGTYIRW